MNGPGVDGHPYEGAAAAYVAAVAERVVVFDGATGTNYQRLGLDTSDFGGEALEGCNEMLNVVRPDVVADLHASFLDVGVDVIETNTFGAFAIPLGEYGITQRSYELAHAGAKIAREVADRYISEDRLRWVAGSIGPGTKFASLGQIGFEELRGAYEEMTLGLLDGGVDLLVIETQFDLLGIKAAVIGARRAMHRRGRFVPIQAQVTIETTGRMLPGTEIGAALAAIEPLAVDVIGLNCATGPEEMYEPVRYLAAHSRLPISVIPNAGMPTVVDGATCYNLTPERLAEHHVRYITELGVTVVGGCCGTTPEHMRRVVEAVGDLTPAPRTPVHEAGAASLYSFVPFHQDTSFLIIGERTNATGSRAFREAMAAEDWDACVRIGKEQVGESAHMVDVSVDAVGRDGVADMSEIAGRFATQVPVPLVIDSTSPDVMEAALQRFGGRAVLNSANLEDGDRSGSRADQVFRLAREYGAAVLCLLIDEEGQARDVEWKMRVAHRIYDLATQRYGLEPSELFFDALTFPLTTGDESLRGDAVATLEAIRRVKTELPGVFTVLGVSNVSFGVKPAARHVLNSVFLHEAVEAGLDAAIIHAGKIMPLNRIPEEQRKVCLDLIYDRRSSGYDPLAALLDVFSDVETSRSAVEDRSDWPVEERLKQRIIDGDRNGLDTDLDEALLEHPALEIVNDVLLDGMKVVGELFGSGEMQLPFVLQSAETMKAAVSYLEPHMERGSTSDRGTIVLATVKGDVHDIGKNLVDIILSNNGYEVHNLGIKVPLTSILERAEAVDADAIGMSGLLVKSTLVMRENLEEMTRRGIDDLPVLLGGAALTRSYVESDLRSVYPGPLYYGKNAFEGLDVMEQITSGAVAVPAAVAGRRDRRRIDGQATSPAETGPGRPSTVAADNQIFEPPFLGSRIVKGIPIDEIAGFVNETALFRNQWQFRPETGEIDLDFKGRIRTVFRERLAVAKAAGLLVPQVVYGYFPVNADGDDLIVWESDDRRVERTRFRFPRQSEHPYLCIADFFRPVGEPDYAAFHIVTMGAMISEETARLFEEHRYQEYLYLHGLGVEMAEALAEYWHRRIRQEWGFADEDDPTVAGLFRQRYRGSRYSWGYPACPDLEDNERVARLLEAERIGVVCNEDTSWQYQPEQTTSAIIVHHPQAKYFVAR